MLDITYILENPQKVKDAARAKNIEVDIDTLVKKITEWKKVATEVQKLREERNKIVKQVQEAVNGQRAKIIDEGKRIKQLLDDKEAQMKKLHDEDIHPLLTNIPNPPKDDVKVGKDDSENEVVRKYKEPTHLSFKPRDHLELGELLDIIDVERAAKVSGARFYYLKNDGALLEQALVRFALDTLLSEGFHFVMPPVLIKTETMQKLGYMENGGAEDMFILDKEGLVLVGTAEQALVPMHMGETLEERNLPLRYVGYSPSFRREAGSYGKDTRGILRVHEFNKVEMVSFVAKGDDDREHEYLLSLEEKLFQALDIPYQVVKMCSGDLGFPAARKYDIEAWMPAQGKYREVTSVSTVTDFQSRRMGTRYKAKDGNTEYVQILNGTAFSIGRPIIAILENYQQEDGSVKIPEVLQKYMGKDRVISQK